MKMGKPLIVNNVAIKIASRCNLNCTYCYIYNMGDNTYEDQPKFISKKTIQLVLEKIENHCEQHNLKEFSIYLFGGEPLLAGKEFFRSFVKQANEFLSLKIKLKFLTQTNGILLDEEWLRLFNECNIDFGISLDGSKEINDQYRIYHSGKGSFDDVMKSIKLLRDNNIRPGINSVVNLDADPVETYNFFKSIGTGDMDFLVPDGNYYQLPPKLKHTETKLDWNNTPYADWLIEIFNIWFFDRRPKPEIRLFTSIIGIILGGNIGYDYVGTTRNELLIIETNGDIEAADDFKICGNGFTKRGYNISKNEFDEVLQDDLIVEYNLSSENLCDQCNNCPVKEICGGWYVPTRYGKVNGFKNPSVFCPDAMKLIVHIQNAVVDEMSKASPDPIEVDKLDYLEAVNYLRLAE